MTAHSHAEGPGRLASLPPRVRRHGARTPHGRLPRLLRERHRPGGVAVRDRIRVIRPFQGFLPRRPHARLFHPPGVWHRLRSPRIARHRAGERRGAARAVLLLLPLLLQLVLPG